MFALLTKGQVNIFFLTSDCFEYRSRFVEIFPIQCSIQIPVDHCTNECLNYAFRLVFHANKFIVLFSEKRVASS